MLNKVRKIANKNRRNRVIAEYLANTVGSIIYAIGIANFLDPNRLAPGGVSGLSIILDKFTPIQTGTWIFLLNVPILLLGLWKFGAKFIVSTLYSILLTTVATNHLATFGPVTSDPMLASIIGGTVVAVGMGLVFKARATTGGSDIIVKLLRRKYRHMKTGMLILITDLIVIAISAVAFKDLEIALFAVISVTVTGVVFDGVLYGRDGAKLVYIISNESEKITARLLQELDVGVTHMQGKGAYSGEQKQVILVVVKKDIYPKAEEIVKEEDPRAFMIITDATEIYGEGYKNIFSEKI
ncbi:MAG: YitT family protein [Lachnospiraceae bacterium]|nr:YitT family protein [Lachnospiraceae bacterium]